MAHDLSVIIVTYNSAEFIVQCLTSLFFSASKSCDMETIIVDNASLDNTVELIHTQFPQAKIIENDNNHGYAMAVNQGVAASNSKYVLILNPDTVLAENFFERLLTFLQRSEDASVVGCRLLTDNSTLQPSCWIVPSISTVLTEMLLPYEVSLRLVTTRPTQTCEVDIVSGACMAIRRDVFEQLHGFDERFFMYYEDFDFCLRSKRAGFKIYFCPEASLVHHLGRSSGVNMTLFFLNLYQSKLLYFRKHFSPFYYRSVYLIVVLGVLLRIAAYGLVGLISFNKPLLRLSKYHTFVLAKII